MDYLWVKEAPKTRTFFSQNVIFFWWRAFSKRSVVFKWFRQYLWLGLSFRKTFLILNMHVYAVYTFLREIWISQEFLRFAIQFQFHRTLGCIYWILLPDVMKMLSIEANLASVELLLFFFKVPELYFFLFSWFLDDFSYKHRLHTNELRHHWDILSNYLIILWRF